MDFIHENTSGAFVLGGDTPNNGPFEYTSLPITLGPLVGNGEEYLFEIVDAEFQDCFAVAEFIAPNCGPSECSINEIIATSLACNPDGTYGLYLNIEYENVTNDYFEVYANGEYFGYYLFDDLPLLLQNFPASGEEYDVITVCQNDSDNCCATEEFLTPDCNQESCMIYGTGFEVLECNDDGLFYAVLYFEYENIGDEGFEVSNDAQNFGQYEYSDLPITIGPFEGNGETYSLVIEDLSLNCGGLAYLESPNCSGLCSIEDVLVETFCDDNGLYVELNFDYSNTSQTGFRINGNGNNYGSYSYWDLPMTLGPLDIPVEIVELVISDIEDETCSNLVSFENIDCLTSTQNLLEERLHIFTIPSNDQLRIEVLGQGTILEQITIFDVIGRPINLPHQNNAQTVDIALTNLPSAVYVCEVITEDGQRLSQKFIKNW